MSDDHDNYWQAVHDVAESILAELEDTDEHQDEVLTRLVDERRGAVQAAQAKFASLEALQKAAEMLTKARNPAILAGSRVVEAGAVEELVTLAETLGAPVMAEQQTSHARPPMPLDHPLYTGMLPLWSPDIRQRLQGHDNCSPSDARYTHQASV
mgnify:CR=1 FL=1